MKRSIWPTSLKSKPFWPLGGLDRKPPDDPGRRTATVLAALAEWTDRPFDDLRTLAGSAWSGSDLVALHLRCVDRLGREPELSAARAQLQRWMGQQSVDIAGEPFKGLQVMGLLESRDSTLTRSSSSTSTRASCRTGARPPSCRWTFSGPMDFPGGLSGTASSQRTCTACSTGPGRCTSSTSGPTWAMGPRNPAGTLPNSPVGPGNPCPAWT